jgi:hypothetical protein
MAGHHSASEPFSGNLQWWEAISLPMAVLPYRGRLSNALVPPLAVTLAFSAIVLYSAPRAYNLLGSTPLAAPSLLLDRIVDVSSVLAEYWIEAAQHEQKSPDPARLSLDQIEPSIQRKLAQEGLSGQSEFGRSVLLAQNKVQEESDPAGLGRLFSRILACDQPLPSGDSRIHSILFQAQAARPKIEAAIAAQNDAAIQKEAGNSALVVFPNRVQLRKLGYNDPEKFIARYLPGKHTALLFRPLAAAEAKSLEVNSFEELAARRETAGLKLVVFSPDKEAVRILGYLKPWELIGGYETAPGRFKQIQSVSDLIGFSIAFMVPIFNEAIVERTQEDAVKQIAAGNYWEQFLDTSRLASFERQRKLCNNLRQDIEPTFLWSWMVMLAAGLAVGLAPACERASRPADYSLSRTRILDMEAAALLLAAFVLSVWIARIAPLPPIPSVPGAEPPLGFPLQTPVPSSTGAGLDSPFPGDGSVGSASKSSVDPNGSHFNRRGIRPEISTLRRRTIQ